MKVRLSGLRNWIDFFGKKIIFFWLFGILIGLSLFIVELAFAYSLQAFFLSMGIINSSVIRLPRWIPQTDFKSVLIFILVVGFGRGVCHWLQVYTQGIATERELELQRSRMIRWVFHSRSVSNAEVTSLFGENIIRVCTATLQLQTLAIQATSALFLGLNLFFMLPTVTAGACLALFLLWLALKRTDRRITESGQGQAREWEKCSNQLSVSIKNLLLMHIYGTENEEEKKAQESLKQYFSHSLSLHRNTAYKFASIQFIGVVLICFIAVASKSSKIIAPGILVTYLYLFVRFVQTFSAVSLASAYLRQCWPYVNKVYAWWYNKSFDGIENQKKISASQALPSPFLKPIGWNLKNVSFAYSENKQPIFKNLDLVVDPARAFVITGPSGIGKSTLLNLMLGGLDPTSGSINIVSPEHDETCSLSSQKKRLLQSIGYVGPESFLIEGSIFDNITYGLQRAPTNNEIQKALELAECHFIFELDKGLDYFLTDQGEGLSAGQKQRLSLARALLRNPRALILDEATSNLDFETEAKLLETFSHLRGQMTIIAVTHRESVLKIADQHLNLN